MAQAQAHVMAGIGQGLWEVGGGGKGELGGRGCEGRFLAAAL